MKRLLLVLNGKGGVGKSFFAINLVQYFKDTGVAHVAIDSDHENSTLKRFHPEVRFLDPDEPRQLDGIVEALSDAGLVIVDCRAASSDLFLDYFDEIDLPALFKELGAILTLAIPVNHEADSVDQVQRLADRLGPNCQYLIVRNAAHSDRFHLYESLEIRERLLGEYGAREIDMPRMQDWLVEILNRENLTVTTATGHPSVSLLDRQRLRTWQRRLYTAIDSVRGLIAASEMAQSAPPKSRSKPANPTGVAEVG